MPTSWYQVASALMDRIIMESPSSVLDVGVGFGKYGVLLRESLDLAFERYHKHQWVTQIDGIEAFGGYRNPVHDYIYDTVYYQPVSECMDSLGTYDVVLMIDTLQHFSKKEGVLLIKKLLTHTRRALIISTPLNPVLQEEYMGNIFEAHKSRWTPIDFAIYNTDFITLPVLDDHALIVRIYPVRVSDEDEARRLSDTELIGLIKPVSREDERLHVAYLLPSPWPTGAMKMMITQMRWLISRGHTVDAYTRGTDTGASALPDWMPAAADRDVVIPEGEEYRAYIRPCDVIVPTECFQIPEILNLEIPILLWEQGSQFLFGDYGDTQYSEPSRDYFRWLHSLPVSIASVSDFVADILDNRYNRKAFVIPCGIDTDVFRPAPEENEEPAVLLVGNPLVPFKRFSTALSVLARIWHEGRRFRVMWISHHYPNTHEAPFPIQVFCNPPQESLPQIYASADILLSASIYEGFGLPPLEAMAAGLAVVSTDCGGVRMYALDEHNALVVQPEDEAAMHRALVRLLDDKALRGELSANARKTALRFSLNKSFLRLEEMLYAVKKQSQGTAGTGAARPASYSELLRKVLAETEELVLRADELPGAAAAELYEKLGAAAKNATLHIEEIDPELRVMLCDRQDEILERVIDVIPAISSPEIKGIYSPAVQAYRRCFNAELMKDKGLAGYMMADVLGARSVMLYGDEKERYPYLEFLPNMDMLYTDVEAGVRDIYYKQLEEDYMKMDALILDGVYEETVQYLSRYRELRPDGKVYCGLDMNSYWMTIIDWASEWCRAFAGQCNLIATSCRFMRDALNRSSNVHFPCRWMPNGFYNPTGIEVVAKAESKRNVILTVGRIGSEQKNNIELLTAFAEACEHLAGWTLRLVGPIEPDFEPVIKHFFEQHPKLRDRVVFTGAIADKAKLYKEYAHAKIFALTSHYEGGTPNVYGEALFHGCRFITSNIDAADDVTNYGELGVQYMRGDIGGLAAALVELCKSSDRSTLEKHIPKAVAYANKYFDWRRNAKKLTYMLLH